MKVGDRLYRDGKLVEVTSVISDTNYGFKPVENVPVVEEPVFDPDTSFEEEVKKETAKKGRSRKKA